jgi:uncharacterized protein (DUF433 family)
MKEFKRITFNKEIMGGQACIRGMRIPVSLIINLVANGMTTEEIIKEYPDRHKGSPSVWLLACQRGTASCT